MFAGGFRDGGSGQQGGAFHPASALDYPQYMHAFPVAQGSMAGLSFRFDKPDADVAPLQGK